MNRPGSQNEGLEESLENLPDEVAKALIGWRMSTLQREKTEALLYLKFKGSSEEKKTADEIKALVRSNGERYTAVIAEIQAEAKYTAIYEKLLSSKRLASLRTAF